MNAPRIETHYAPAARTAPAELARRLGLLANNPVTDVLLETVGGLLAILDRNRQILAVNHGFLAALGYREVADVLGLRPGEAIRCIHAHEPPQGCGTTLHCATCGAVIAMMGALAEGRPQERLCVAEVVRNGATQDLVLRVRASPVDLGGERILLLFLQDAGPEQRRASLEQVFYHDVANVLQGLAVAAELVQEEQDERERRQLAGQIGRLVDQLNREVQLQRLLHQDDLQRLKLTRTEVPVAAVLDEVRRVFLHHPAARGRTLAVASGDPGATATTDLWLLVRVLVNLVVNALEATEPGGRVDVRADCGRAGVVFHVLNPAAIPREIQPRIFQKNFSTKPGPGHGLGAWSARLFTERLLGGELTFTSTDRAGTDFQVCLPL
ncbi:MAG: sensor histidine kinase [Krumholzibacteria bacterium]|nr:sensor histidine kinase [Candidatus Krumholzibacteria bacterium]